MSSLRERRRKRTADTIRRAAVDLVYEHGLDNVTTEMISEAAGISPRTFFNYFSYKEAAFVPPAMDFDSLEFEQFIKSDGDLVEDVSTLVLSAIDEFGRDREFMQKIHAIEMKSPKLMMLRMSTFHEYELKFSELLKIRLSKSVNDVEALQISAMLMASIRVGFEIWIAGAEGSLLENVRWRLMAIKTIFNGH